MPSQLALRVMSPDTSFGVAPVDVGVFKEAVSV